MNPKLGKEQALTFYEKTFLDGQKRVLAEPDKIASAEPVLGAIVESKAKSLTH